MKSGDVYYFQVQNCISLSFYFFFFLHPISLQFIPPNHVEVISRPIGL